MADFADRIKQTRQAGPEGRQRAAETFITPPGDPVPREVPPAATPPSKEPRQMLTIRVPVSMHEKLRRTAFETGVSMQDQLIAAWEAQQQN